MLERLEVVLRGCVGESWNRKTTLLVSNGIKFKHFNLSS